MYGRGIGETYQSARFAAAQQAYQDLSTNPVLYDELKKSLVNLEYVNSVNRETLKLLVTTRGLTKPLKMRDKYRIEHNPSLFHKETEEDDE